MSTAFAKVQRWLSMRVSRREKDKDRPRVAIRRSATAESELSPKASVDVLELPDSPGEKRRSNSFCLSRSFSTPPRQRSRSAGASELKRAKELAQQRKKEMENADSPQPSGAKPNLEILDPSRMQDGWIRGVGGELIQLSDEVLTGPLKRQGYLQKHGRRLRGWKRRWFVLDRSDIAIYKNDSCNSLTGMIAIALVETVLFPASVASFGFTFEVVMPKRSYILAAPSEEDALSWAHLIRRAMCSGERVSIFSHVSASSPSAKTSALTFDLPPEEEKRLADGLMSSVDLTLTGMAELAGFLERHPPTEAVSSSPEPSRAVSAVDELSDFLRAH